MTHAMRAQPLRDTQIVTPHHWPRGHVMPGRVMHPAPATRARRSRMHIVHDRPTDRATTGVHSPIDPDHPRIVTHITTLLSPAIASATSAGDSPG